MKSEKTLASIIFRKYYFGGIFCTPDDFEASHAFGTGPPTPLTDNILVDSICLLANSVSMYYSFKGDSSKPGGVTHLQGSSNLLQVQRGAVSTKQSIPGP